MAAQAPRHTGTPPARRRSLVRRGRGADAARRRRATAAASPVGWAVVVLAGVLVAGTAGGGDGAPAVGTERAAMAQPQTPHRSAAGAPGASPAGERPAVPGAAVDVQPVAGDVEPLPPGPALDPERDARLAALEAAVVAAETAATELASAQALTPRPARVRIPDGDQHFLRVHAPGGAGARLHPDAPPAVVALVRTHSNGAIPPEALCPVPFTRSALLQCDAAEALVELDAAFLEEFGTHLSVTSAYRTFESQVGLRAAKGGLAAVPGTSNHGWGLAVDLGGIGGLGEFDSLQYLWLKANAERFGWHHPRAMEPGGGGPQEPWHWEFATA